MKKINNIVAILLMAFAISSCNDAIDIEQPGLLLAENAFQSVDDVEAGLYGAYNSFDITDEIRFNANYTDEWTPGLVNGGQNRAEYSLILTPASNGDRPASLIIWQKYYLALANVNNLISAANTITPDPDVDNEVENYNDFVGQAYALRAYAHFQLQTYYTTDYTDDSALGAIALDYVPAVGEQLPRNTNGEVFTLIENDLTLANSLLSDSNSNPTLINKDFVKALRARMAAYRGDYATAGPLANQLLADYPIASQADFFNIWEDTSNAEIIFKLERTQNDNYEAQATAGGGTAGSLFAFGNSTIDGTPFMEMDRELFNSFDDADIRKERYIDPTSIISPDYQNEANYKEGDVLVVRKYPGSETVNLMNDLKVFRSAEMLFIAAEAAADNNDFGTVAQLIKQLREARLGSTQPTPSYTSQTEAFGAILDERRLELAYEGHRWVDIKRLGAKGNRTLDREPLDCATANATACTMPNTDTRFTMPIPLDEIDVNPALSQNPGY
ncbi:RagB/SusD family nutrient uptake outer membrane protein [Lacinutrix sp. 5H-3-7-4]|uniref:RagB/SusD family nutrient uptake outer membrane protein n=1 Tax=Lacinutrix sp. (strain 5H-3-7-4) TaxID=983544 RepID=UPI00020A364D|nr:RagB/SusD family nutrient uptake outer membrane protein [Lacinutrix sp. 5H-3-7-4]AEH00274.1 RagB/SusD domain-containing protein [Lacinutrix sp. 5H-3-7-4]